MLFLISISIVLCLTVLGFLCDPAADALSSKFSHRPIVSCRMNQENQTFPEAIGFTVILLVVSVPLAIEVVTTTTMALGSRALSAEGAIVVRLASIEELAGSASLPHTFPSSFFEAGSSRSPPCPPSVNMLCSDKTGTLTMNKMALQDDTPIFEDGATQADVLLYAALAAKARVAWLIQTRCIISTFFV